MGEQAKQEPEQQPELKQLVAEASLALARLDADRLEELALCCQALNRDPEPLEPEQSAELARQSREAAAEMATLARVLEATRANLHVMHRLRELHEGALEYGPALVQPWTETGSGHGNH